MGSHYRPLPQASCGWLRLAPLSKQYCKITERGSLFSFSFFFSPHLQAPQVHFESYFRNRVGEEIVCPQLLFKNFYYKSSKMESAGDQSSGQKVIPSKPEASLQESNNDELSSVAAANQPDNETVAVMKEAQPLDRAPGVDEEGEEPMDTSLSKEETRSNNKVEPETNQESTIAPPCVQEGEIPPFYVLVHVCVHVCTYMCVCVLVLLD